MDAFTGPALEVLVRDIHLTHFCWIAAVTALAYEIVLTLHLEVKYFWKRRRGWLFFVFLTNRYVVLLLVGFDLYGLSWKRPSKQTCSRYTIYLGFSPVICHIASGVILILRVASLHRNNRSILVSLIGLFAVQLASEAGIMASILIPTEVIELPEFFTGCAVTGMPRWTWTYPLPFLIFETVCFSLIAYKVWGLWVDKIKISTLQFIIIRDSLVAFAILMAANLTLVLVWALARLSLFQTFTIPVFACQSILAGRLLFNIRERASHPGLHIISISQGEDGEERFRTHRLDMDTVRDDWTVTAYWLISKGNI